MARTANLVMLPAQRLEGDGVTAWATLRAKGCEGLVAKDPASSYRPGPTRGWIKVKRAEAVRRTWPPGGPDPPVGTA